MLLLLVQSTKNASILARIKETNDVNIVVPVVFRMQIRILMVVIKITTAEVIVQRSLPLLRMRLNQNAIVSKRWMIWRNQKHQRFVAVRIESNLVALRVRGGNCVVALEQIVNNCPPSWHRALTKCRYSCSARISTFDDSK